MKTIELTQGQVTLVDDEDYEELNKYKWHALIRYDGHSFDAVRASKTINGKRKLIIMSRAIIGESDAYVDHWNHDTLDNQRSNLRVCSNAENQHNQKPHVGGSSIYKGVTWHQKARKWQVQIMLKGHSYYLGLFTDEVIAAIAYDVKARELFGNFALTNFTIGEDT